MPLPLLLLAALPSACEPTVGTEIEARYQALEERLEALEGPTERWFYGFAGLHGGLMVGALALAQHSDSPGGKKELYTAAFGSGVGLVSLVAFEPKTLAALEVLRGARASDLETKRAAILRAEALLRRHAASARFGRSWLAHLISGAYAIGAAAVLWKGFDRPRGAVRQLIGGMIIGQGRLLLAPSDVDETWQAHARQFPGACGEVSAARAPEVRWGVGLVPNGAGVWFEF